MGQLAENSFDVRRDKLTKRVIRLGLLKPHNPSHFYQAKLIKAPYGTFLAGTLSEVKLRGDAAALCLPCFKRWALGFRASRSDEGSGSMPEFAAVDTKFRVQGSLGSGGFGFGAYRDYKALGRTRHCAWILVRPTKLMTLVGCRLQSCQHLPSSYCMKGLSMRSSFCGILGAESCPSLWFRFIVRAQRWAGAEELQNTEPFMSESAEATREPTGSLNKMNHEPSQ